MIEAIHTIIHGKGEALKAGDMGDLGAELEQKLVASGFARFVEVPVDAAAAEAAAKAAAEAEAAAAAKSKGKGGKAESKAESKDDL